MLKGSNSEWKSNFIYIYIWAPILYVWGKVFPLYVWGISQFPSLSLKPTSFRLNEK